MFSVGDLIVYNETGVCRVEQIGPPAFNPRERRDYYTLTPLYGAGTIYVPVDSGVFMRLVLSREEAEALIDELLTLENPYNCPHGRPTIVSMSRYDLDRKFKRIV